MKENNNYFVSQLENMRALSLSLALCVSLPRWSLSACILLALAILMPLLANGFKTVLAVWASVSITVSVIH